VKKLLLLLVVFNAPLYLCAQGTVRGKVTDDKGESLIGVTVYSKTNKTIGVFTDFDGNFSIKIPDSLVTTLVVSYMSYTTKEEKIGRLKNNKVIIKNFSLVSSENALTEVVIEGRAVKANENYAENLQKNSPVVINVMNSETMKKTGDQNITAAVARVSGVSVSGGLISVRGMSDRYVRTTFNGSMIPTLDPLTNNIQLDMFPASLIDNIIFTKTASPDIRGDFSAAYISVETKDYPEKLILNFETQVGYNNQSTFKDMISSERSSTDWLGYDNGLRERTQKHSELYNTGRGQISASAATAAFSSTSYQEMVALGLGDYYKSLGVTGFDNQGTYFNLGLVQLGILKPAMINDAQAISAASLEYRISYKPKAFKILYPDGSDFNNGFANNWEPKRRKAPLNFSQSISFGNQTTLFGKSLGYIVSVRYGTSTRYDANGVSTRIFYDANSAAFSALNYSQEISRETNGWSALFNLSYKLNSQNSVSFLYMPNQSGVNDIFALHEKIDPNNLQRIDYQNNLSQFYEQRRQNIYQLKSEHYVPKAKMKIDFNGSYTMGKSNVPDFKNLEYKSDELGNITQLAPTAGEGMRRFYRYLSENILDGRLSAELPLSKPHKAGARKIKFGVAYEENNRKPENYGYSVINGTSSAPLAQTVAEELNTSNFIMQDGKINYGYDRDANNVTNIEGMSVIKSAFVMLDYSIIKAIRVSGGLRLEKTNVFTNVYAYYDAFGYNKNGLRAENKNGDLNNINYLPSLNTVFKLLDNGKTLINARLNYSQTLARPSIRELTDYALYDNEFRTRFYGNPSLKMVDIKNYDFRFEAYFKNGDNVSVSVFRKDIKNNIEMAFGDAGITWLNSDKSNVNGLELEGKKGLSKYFELKANVTFVKSITTYSNTSTSGERPLYGQAPYIFNGIAVFKADSIGLVATLSYNVQGSRIVISTDNLIYDPSVSEMPRHLVDFKISKKLGKHFTASLTVRDLLNSPVKREYRQKDGSKLNASLPDIRYDSFRYGTNFNLGISYKL